MISKVFFVVALAAVAYGGRSPNADIVENFKNSPLGSRYSSNIYEDALLDVPGLIKKYGYPVEIHTVTTSDGYVLEMHRIPHGKNQNSQPGKKPAILLMHGLLSSSADYVILGPENALAYLLAEAGYDVWMGNARGNYYSRKHVSMNPNSLFTRYWLFSWEEMGLYDLPTFIDYILDLTGEEQLHYVGHSQGGTVFLVLNSMKPEYNAKIKSFHGFAPASYFTHNDHEIFNNLAQYEKLIESAAIMLGTGEILNNEQAQSLLESRVCDGAPIHDPFCIATIMNGSVSLSTLNATMLPLFLSHAPAGASIRQVAHFAQVVRRDSFARFYHSVVTNLLLYGRINPPEYDVSKVTVPSYLYYGFADAEVDWRDLHKLASKLGNTVATVRAERDDFNHYDFIWGTDARNLIFEKVVRTLNKLDRDASL